MRFLLDDPYHIAGDGVQRGRTAQAHRVGQLIAELGCVGGDAVGTGTVDGGDEGPRDQHGVCAEGQRLDAVALGGVAAFGVGGAPTQEIITK